MDPVELLVQRSNTAAFIAADPVALVLKHYERVQTPARGWKTQETGTTNAICRLIPANDRTPEVRSTAGTTIKPDYTLLGAHDCDMREDDEFIFHGVTYQIVGPVRPLHTEFAYQRKGDVVRKERLDV